jgi:hypothetical protein
MKGVRVTHVYAVPLGVVLKLLLVCKFSLGHVPLGLSRI